MRSAPCAPGQRCTGPGAEEVLDSTTALDLPADACSAEKEVISLTSGSRPAGPSWPRNAARRQQVALLRRVWAGNSRHLDRDRPTPKAAEKVEIDPSDPRLVLTVGRAAIGRPAGGTVLNDLPSRCAGVGA